MSAAHGRTGERRLTFGAWTAALVIAVTAICVIAALLASVHRARLDLTATRRHTLAERTQAILDRLETPHQVIVVAERQGLDSLSLQRLSDVLAAMESAGDRLSVSWVDPTTQGGRAAYGSLRQEVAALYAAELERHLEAVQTAAAAAVGLASGLETFSALLGERREALTKIPGLEGQVEALAAAARVNARRTRTLGESAQESLEAAADVAAIPPTDEARRRLAPGLSELAEQLDALASSLQSVQPPGDAQAEATEALRDVIQQVVRLRDRAARQADALDRLGRSMAHAVDAALQRGDAVVVLSEAGATAAPLGALFPDRAAVEAAGASAPRFVGEEIIATALVTLSDRPKPIVVFVHGGARARLDSAGLPATEEAQWALGSLIRRLHLRGADTAEWAPAVDSARPTFTGLDPVGDRPIVWVTLAISATTREAATQMGALSDAVRRLVADGESVLISVEPSPLPGVGEPDPMVQFLEPLGIEVRSGLPLVQRSPTAGGGSAVSAEHVVRRTASDHPIAQVVRGLPALLLWPCPIEVSETADPNVTLWPLLEIEHGAGRWAESEWLRLRAVPPAQRSIMRDPPEPNPTRDDVDGPWTVAAAAERLGAEAGELQRLVVVASNGWFLDPIVERRAAAAGRTVARYPGNGELFEASVAWLAGMDDLLAPSPRAGDTPRIAPLDEDSLLALRWALALGPPAVVLALGGLLRLWRG